MVTGSLTVIDRLMKHMFAMKPSEREALLRLLEEPGVEIRPNEIASAYVDAKGQLDTLRRGDIALRRVGAGVALKMGSLLQHGATELVKARGLSGVAALEQAQIDLVWRLSEFLIDGEIDRNDIKEWAPRPDSMTEKYVREFFDLPE